MFVDAHVCTNIHIDAHVHINSYSHGHDQGHDRRDGHGHDYSGNQSNDQCHHVHVHVHVHGCHVYGDASGHIHLYDTVTPTALVTMADTITAKNTPTPIGAHIHAKQCQPRLFMVTVTSTAIYS